MSTEAIILTGPKFAGKDEAGELIALRTGGVHSQISAPIRAVALERGIDPIRENLIALGTELAKTEGEDYLARRALKAGSFVIVSGVRQLAQIEYIRSNTTRSSIIAVDALPEIRYQRGKHEATNLEAFIESERVENSGIGPQRLFDCMKLADFTITNNGTLIEYYAEVNQALKQLGY